MTELPADVTNAETMLVHHDSKKHKIEEIINFSSQEGEQIVVRVRQQVSYNLCFVSYCVWGGGGGVR